MRFVLQRDYSTDEIPEWIDIAEHDTIIGLLDEEHGSQYQRVIDTQTGDVVAQLQQDWSWKIDPDGLARVAPTIDYTAFALKLLDEH